MSNTVLEVRRLLVRRGGRNILQVENLTVQSGQVVAVLGPNGAGKSTLLKCLLGFVRPTAGGVRVLGSRIAPHRGVSLARLRCRVGYVPQVLAAHSETPLCVREVVAIGRSGIAGLFRRLRGSDWEIVDSWLERLGLADLSRRAYSALSGGEQRKTLIAKAMVQQPEILILDEPTANLDLFWREQIVATLEKLHEDSILDRPAGVPRPGGDSDVLWAAVVAATGQGGRRWPARKRPHGGTAGIPVRTAAEVGGFKRPLHRGARGRTAT